VSSLSVSFDTVSL